MEEKKEEGEQEKKRRKKKEGSKKKKKEEERQKAAELTESVLYHPGAPRACITFQLLADTTFKVLTNELLNLL